MTCGRLFIIYYFRRIDLYTLVAAMPPSPLFIDMRVLGMVEAEPGFWKSSRTMLSRTRFGGVVQCVRIWHPSTGRYAARSNPSPNL